MILIKKVIKNPKFEDDSQARISKYKNIFTKGYTPNWSEEVFVIKKFKILFRGHTLLVIIMVKRLLNVLQKRIAKSKSKIV